MAQKQFKLLIRKCMLQPQTLQHGQDEQLHQPLNWRLWRTCSTLTLTHVGQKAANTRFLPNFLEPPVPTPFTYEGQIQHETVNQ